MNSDGDLLTTRSLSVGRDRVTFGCVVVGRLIANASRRYPRGLHNRHRTGRKESSFLLQHPPRFFVSRVVTSSREQGKEEGPGYRAPGKRGAYLIRTIPRGPGPVTGELWGKPGKKSFMAVYNPITEICIRRRVSWLTSFCRRILIPHFQFFQDVFVV